MLMLRIACIMLQVVAPKKQSLEQAESIFEENMAKLRIKQAELQEITEKLNKLNEDLDTKQTEKKVYKYFAKNLTLFQFSFLTDGYNVMQLANNIWPKIYTKQNIKYEIHVIVAIFLSVFINNVTL
jgi:predicted metal-dependent hydrolase